MPHRCACLLALLGLAVAATPGRAGLLIRVPFVSIQVGKPASPVIIAPPAPVVAAPQRMRVEVPVPVELPPPLVAVPPALPPVVAVRALTHQEFAACFKPAPGNYEVQLIHPGSKCAVPVCFTLPAGCPKVVVRHRELVFDYGKHEVEIRFKLGGKVAVNYR